MQFINLRFIVFVILLLSIFLFSSCAQQAAFGKKVALPSASGRAKMKKDDNNNYAISLQANNLTTQAA